MDFIQDPNGDGFIPLDFLPYSPVDPGHKPNKEELVSVSCAHPGSVLVRCSDGVSQTSYSSFAQIGQSRPRLPEGGPLYLIYITTPCSRRGT
jgi:hypothetical protein